MATAEAQLATLFLALSRRLGLPQPPAPVISSVPALLTGGFHPATVYEPRSEVLTQVDVDDLLGPQGPQCDSPTMKHSSLQLGFEHAPEVDPFWRHVNTPWKTALLPSEFQFLGNGELQSFVLCIVPSFRSDGELPADQSHLEYSGKGIWHGSRRDASLRTVYK